MQDKTSNNATPTVVDVVSIPMPDTIRIKQERMDEPERKNKVQADSTVMTWIPMKNNHIFVKMYNDDDIFCRAYWNRKSFVHRGF